MERQRNLLVGAMLFGAMFMVPSAYAHIFEMPDTNTLQVEADENGYAISGSYLEYTSVGSAVSVNPLGNSAVEVLIQEQEDWRGQFSLVPNIINHITAHSGLWSNLDASSLESPRSKHGRWFGKSVPSTKSIEIIADLQSPSAREDLKSMLRSIGKGAMLSYSQLEGLIATLKL